MRAAKVAMERINVDPLSSDVWKRAVQVVARSTATTLEGALIQTIQDGNITKDEKKSRLKKVIANVADQAQEFGKEVKDGMLAAVSEKAMTTVLHG